MARDRAALACIVAFALIGCRPKESEVLPPLVANDPGGKVVGRQAGRSQIRGPCDHRNPHLPCWWQDLVDVHEASENFMSKNPGRCPTPGQLKSLGFLLDSAFITDPSGAEFVIECGTDGVTVHPKGDERMKVTSEKIPGTKGE